MSAPHLATRVVLTVTRNWYALNQLESIRAFERGNLSIRELGRELIRLLRKIKLGLFQLQSVDSRNTEDLRTEDD